MQSLYRLVHAVVVIVAIQLATDND